MIRKAHVLTAGLLAILTISLSGCAIKPPIRDDGQFQEYGSLWEIMRHIDHYAPRFRAQGATFRTSIRSFNDLMLYGDYLKALCRQARYWYGTDRPEFSARCTALSREVWRIMTLARGLSTDQDMVPQLMEQLDVMVRALRKSA